jgi:hypothetical protein
MWEEMIYTGEDIYGRPLVYLQSSSQIGKFYYVP